MSSDKGYVFIAKHRFPVIDVRLRGGGIEVTYEIRGPLAPFSGHITMFGEDSQGIMQGHTVQINGVNKGETLTCHHSLKLTNIESYDMTSAY